MSSIPALTTGDLGRVRVELTVGRRRVRRGTAAAALRDTRLSAGERAAIRSMVRAVQVLRERVGQVGIDDARTAVTLVLRDTEATSGGPWASEQVIAVGRTNALAGRAPVPARRGVLLPTDVALHELTHVIQFRGMADGAKPHGALLEGMADAVALLATNDSLLGEEYFGRSGGRDAVRGAIRDLDPAVRPMRVEVLGPTLRSLDEVKGAGAEVHDAGGVVSTVFVGLRASLGRDVAERLLWSLLRDGATWRAGGSWANFAAGLRRAAAAAGDQRIIDAVDAQLRTAGMPAPASSAAAA